MKKLLVAAALIGMTVLAQDTLKAPAQTANLPTRERMGTPAIGVFNRATSVIGMPVEESSGKVVGKVHDLVFDLESSKLSYAVLALGENRMVPVPITALKKAEDHFVLNMTPALLAAAPGIQNDDWPSVDAFAVGAPAQSETGHGKSSD